MTALKIRLGGRRYVVRVADDAPDVIRVPYPDATAPEFVAEVKVWRDPDGRPYRLEQLSWQPDPWWIKNQDGTSNVKAGGQWYGVEQVDEVE
jgi:hypothetical protein